MGPGPLSSGSDKCVIVLEVQGPMDDAEVTAFNNALNDLLTTYSGKLKKTYITRGKKVDWHPH